MFILGFSISKRYPFVHLGNWHIDGRNTIRMKWKFGNRHNKIVVRGHNNIIESIGKVYESTFRVIGDNNKINILHNCKILDSSFVIIGNQCNITFQEKSTCGHGCWFVVMGNGHHISIGQDTMISDDVDIWASDSHAIFKDGNEADVINLSGDIDIGAHVWIGKKSVVLKNVRINENAIVGIASVVTKDVPANCIVVGNPAHVVNVGINWERSHIKV